MGLIVVEDVGMLELSSSLLLSLVGFGDSDDVSLVLVAIDGTSWMSRLTAIAAENGGNVLVCFGSLAISRIVFHRRDHMGT